MAQSTWSPLPLFCPQESSTMWPLMTGKLQGNTGLMEEMADSWLTFGGKKGKRKTSYGVRPFDHLDYVLLSARWLGHFEHLAYKVATGWSVRGGCKGVIKCTWFSLKADSIKTALHTSRCRVTVHVLPSPWRETIILKNCFIFTCESLQQGFQGFSEQLNGGPNHHIIQIISCMYTQKVQFNKVINQWLVTLTQQTISSHL